MSAKKQRRQKRSRSSCPGLLVGSYFTASSTETLHSPPTRLCPELEKHLNLSRGDPQVPQDALVLRPVQNGGRDSAQRRNSRAHRSTGRSVWDRKSVLAHQQLVKNPRKQLKSFHGEEKVLVEGTNHHSCLSLWRRPVHKGDGGRARNRWQLWPAVFCVLGLAQFGSFQLSLARLSLAQFGLAQFGSAQLGSFRLSLAGLSLARLSWAQFGSSQFGSSRHLKTRYKCGMVSGCKGP